MDSNAGRRHADPLAMSSLGAGREFDMIRTFLAHAKRNSAAVAVGPGDDCAIIGSHAISTDMSIEDVHFRRAWLQPEEIGYRAAAAALSDLAAVAARPIAALVSFAFEQNDAGVWAEAVMRGATHAIEEFDAVLAGGDVTRSPRGATLDVVVLGEVGAPILRSGARAGDGIWVTGALGGAGAAVRAWQDGRDPAVQARVRYARPVPRIREALWLAGRVSLNALLDISDGIAGDAGHIAAASSCRLTIDAALLPVHSDATVQDALAGGEDYELCFTASDQEVNEVKLQFERTFDVALTRIGAVERGHGVVLLNGPAATGFDHFAGPHSK